MSACAPTVVCLPRTVRPAPGPSRGASPVPVARPAGGVVAAWRAAADRWRRWRRVRAGLAELRALDDRMLADLGLDRGGVERAARSGRG